jgi:HTH-type transcriptional regulator / antitoxin MqsA
MNKIETCPVCSNTDFQTSTEERSIRARDGTELPYSAEYSRCTKCGEEFFTRSQSRRASKAAATALRQHAGLLTPAEIVGIRAMYGVTQVELERTLKLGKKSIVRWEAGTVCQSQAADRLLREVRESPALFLRLAKEAGVTLNLEPSSATVWDVVVTKVVSLPPHAGRARRRKIRTRVSGTYRVVERKSFVAQGRTSFNQSGSKDLQGALASSPSCGIT